MKRALLIGVLSLALCGAAQATDVSYTKEVGAVHLTGTVEVDDSSGDIVSVSGEASGAVSGKYTLDMINPNAGIAGQGSSQGAKLALHFDRRNQLVTAQLDSGNPVTVWEKP